MPNKFLFEIRTVCEIMWQNMVEPDVTANTQFSCRIIHAKIVYNFFHGHNGYANVRPCYVVGALPILLNCLDAFGGIYHYIS